MLLNCCPKETIIKLDNSDFPCDTIRGFHIDISKDSIVEVDRNQFPENGESIICIDTVESIIIVPKIK